MINFKAKKNWFTLAETIIVCSLFAVMVIGIIFGINRAFVFLNNTRLQVMATNFAREWVEMVYNIRDTNWRKYPWDKDVHWMDSWSWYILTPWIYIIKEWTTWSSNDSYVYAENITNNTGFYEMEGFFDDSNSSLKEKSMLIFTWSYSYNSGWEIVVWNMEELMNWFWTNFYRILRVYWVYKKDEPTPSVSTTSYTTSEPKELRFCVKVFYEWSTWKHAKELCSIMTNFMK